MQRTTLALLMNGANPLTHSKLPILTEYYQLGIGEDKNGRSIYEVLNLETGVVEYDDYILPRSLEALFNLTEKLTDVYKTLGEDKPTSLSLVKGEADGEGSLH